MKPKTYAKKIKNYYDVFPEKRDFYFLDSYENIKNFNTTNFEDPEYICVISQTSDENIKENCYKRNEFKNDYEFIKVTEKTKNISINFIISKNKINIGGRETRLLTEIKLRKKMMKEIERNLKINFNSNDNIFFKEAFSVPDELKFYNRIFTLYILKQNLNIINNNQNKLNDNINKNNNNNNNSNNGYNNYTNINPNQNYNNFGTFGSNINNINIINYNFSHNFQKTGVSNNNYNEQTIQNNFPNYNNNNNNYQGNFCQTNNPNEVNNNYKFFNYDQYVIKPNQNNNNININNNQININGTNAQNNNYKINNQNQTQNYYSQNRNFGMNQGSKLQNLTQQNQNYSKNGGNIIQPKNDFSQIGLSSQQQLQTGTNPSQQGTNPSQPGTNPSQPGTNASQPGTDASQPPERPIPQKPYIFSMKGLKNIGSTCYMNATLQCLLHVSELTVYFIDEYPKDQKFLLDTNKYVPSGGNISREFFNLVIGVNDSLDYAKGKSNSLNPKTNKKSSNSFFSFLGFGDSYDDSSYDRAFAPKDFKRTLGKYNPQFQKFEANDSKDLILYLLQTMHDELNYYGNRNQRLNYVPNQYNIYETYNHFIANYNMNNFSKISLLFYGTYKNTTTCTICKRELYNFQKFEFISFGMYYYNRKKFNILDGFRDNSSPTMLKGDNKFLCNSCNKLQEAQTTCKIFEPPQKLLINIDYGKNKKYQPTAIEFSEEIDITEFVDFNFQQKIRYKIIGVCTHYGHSGSYGHYVAFCRNRENDKWYEFNDSFCSECNKREIYRGSPYLLLYERVFN